MNNYKQYLESFIKTGKFDIDDLAYKLDKMYVEGKISESDRDELLLLANEYAKDSEQINWMDKLVDLEHRIVALETKDIPVWKSGYSTKKGEVVKFDYDKDGEYDLLRYDGGRSYTALAPGKIDGWHVVDSECNILGTYHNGEFTPVGEEDDSEEPASESEE